jgi:integrase
MPYVQRQLGHSSLATTANYLASIGNAEVVDAVFARVWPS